MMGLWIMFKNAMAWKLLRLAMRISDNRSDEGYIFQDAIAYGVRAAIEKAGILEKIKKDKGE